jgi:hypothetical protein
MFSARLFIYIGLAFFLVISMIACKSTIPAAPVAIPKTQPPAAVENQQPAETPPSEASTENEAGWTHVKSFIGKDDQTTAPFPISGTKWRIKWTVDAQDPEYAVFDILVFSKDNAAMLTQPVSYSKGMTGDTAYIDEGGHDYYLKIIAANLNNWNITVEDYAGDDSAGEPLEITHIRYKGMDYSSTKMAYHRIVEWDEYVEIKNTSYSPQNIAGWKLKNITKGQPTFVFPLFKPCSCEYLGSWQKCVEECYPPRPNVIEPRESIKVYTGEPNWESGGYCFYYEQGDIWNNLTPDTAVLYNAEGIEVSRGSYTIYTTNKATSTK